jgi:hypothetical protein
MTGTSSAHDSTITANKTASQSPAILVIARDADIGALLDDERRLWQQMQELRLTLYRSVSAELERETGPDALDAVGRYATAILSYLENIDVVRDLLWPRPDAHGHDAS